MGVKYIKDSRADILLYRKWNIYFDLDESNRCMVEVGVEEQCSFLQKDKTYSNLEFYGTIIKDIKYAEGFAFGWGGMISASLSKKLRFCIGIENEDAEFGYRLFLIASRICVNDEKVYNYRIRPNSICEHAVSKNGKLPSYKQEIQDIFQDRNLTNDYMRIFANVTIIENLEEFISQIDEQNRVELKYCMIKILKSRFKNRICPYIKVLEISDPKNLKQRINILNKKGYRMDIKNWLRLKFPFIFCFFKKIKDKIV